MIYFRASAISMTLLPTLAALAWASSACKATGSDSDLNVYLGQTTSGYPEVAELTIPIRGGTATCTGVFVSSTTLLTAAHCIFPSTALVRGSQRITPRFVEHGPLSGRAADNGSLDRRHDLAVMVFPAGTSSAFAEVAPLTGSLPQTGTIVGYGLDTTRFSAGTKRLGTVSIDEVGATNMRSAPGPNSARSGDSGGPLYVNNRVVGIISAFVSPPNEQGGVPVSNYYVNLATPDALQLLNNAVARGAEIRGLSSLGQGTSGRPGPTIQPPVSPNPSTPTQPVSSLPSRPSLSGTFSTQRNERLVFIDGSRARLESGNTSAPCIYRVNNNNLVDIACDGRPEQTYELQSNGSVLRERNSGLVYSRQ